MGVGNVEIMDAVGVKVGVVPHGGVRIEAEAEFPALLERVGDGLQASLVEAVLDGPLVGVAGEVGDGEEQGLRPHGLRRHRWS